MRNTNDISESMALSNLNDWTIPSFSVRRRAPARAMCHDKQSATMTTRFLASIVLLLTALPVIHSRPADTQESEHESAIQRIRSGLGMALDLMHSMADPSRIQRGNIQPTRIKVLFAGLGRTGTTSLVAAMNMLDYRCVHDDEGSAVMDLYADLYDGKLTDDQVQTQIGERGFNCSFMYTDYEWAAKQDDVKVVLNTRDPEKWVDSWLTVADGYDILSGRPFCWFKSVRDSLPVMKVAFKDIPTGGQPEGYLDRDTLLTGYQIHSDKVIRAVPPERLLIYSVKQGWEPLCDFLGVDVPDEPFPHINDRLKIKAVFTVLRIISWIWPMVLALPFLLLGRHAKRYLVHSDKQKSD